MLTKTIGQLDEVTTLDTSDVFEVEASGVSKKITLDTLAALSGHFVGETVFSELKKAVSPAFPGISRAVNIDVDAANYPLLVSEYRAEQLEFLGVSEWQATVTGSVVTFVAGSTAATALCALFQQDAVVSSWLNTSEPASFTNTADYTTVSTKRCINVNGIDYSVKACSSVSLNFTLDSAPTAGSATVKVYPYRISGETAKARLLKLSGSALIAAGDAGGEVVAGFRKMDRGQVLTGETGHSSTQGLIFATGNPTGVFSLGTEQTDNNTTGGTTNAFNINFNSANSPNARTGKTTDPRTAGMNVYTWAGVYIP